LIQIYQNKTPTEQFLSACLKTAWAEAPALAIQFCQRFQSPILGQSLRFLLLSFPEKVLNNSEAAEIIIGEAFPTDTTYQLKV
jgi:phosphatidylinositol 4-kinase A